MLFEFLAFSFLNYSYEQAEIKYSRRERTVVKNRFFDGFYGTILGCIGQFTSQWHAGRDVRCTRKKS